jgi:BON domain
MGEYEDRYPDAYGRDEAIAQPTPREEIVHPTAPRQVRESSWPIDRAPTTVEPVAAPPATSSPATDAAKTAGGSYRGVAPRGYVRSSQRIYEDICDRLTDNPFIDATDIEVAVHGMEVTLSGSVDSTIALRQAQEIAEEVAGVSRVDNRLRLREPAGAERADTPGDRVNRAMGAPGRR